MAIDNFNPKMLTFKLNSTEYASEYVEMMHAEIENLPPSFQIEIKNLTVDSISRRWELNPVLNNFIILYCNIAVGYIEFCRETKEGNKYNIAYFVKNDYRGYRIIYTVFPAILTHFRKHIIEEASILNIRTENSISEKIAIKLGFKHKCKDTFYPDTDKEFSATRYSKVVSPSTTGILNTIRHFIRHLLS